MLRRCLSQGAGLITRTVRKVLSVCVSITGSIMKRLEAFGQRLSMIGQVMQQMLLDTWQSVLKTLKCSIKSLRKRLRIQDTTHLESACNGILETKGGDATTATSSSTRTANESGKARRGRKTTKKNERPKKGR